MDCSDMQRKKNPFENLKNVHTENNNGSNHIVDCILFNFFVKMDKNGFIFFLSENMAFELDMVSLTSRKGK